jgi:serine/threonine protein phosphatase 1
MTTIEFSNSIEPGDVIAVGDIHGRSDLLDLFLGHVRGSGTTVILLGDLIDRGPDDAGVLDRVKHLLDDPESCGLAGFHCVMGNHERLMLDAEGGRLGEISAWLNNGGNASGQLDRILAHTGWISELPLYITIGDTLFIHAGVPPGEDPAAYTHTRRLREQLLWIRKPFLTSGPMLSEWTSKLKRVVHGHTPYLDDERIGTVNVSGSGDRVGIDTAAVYSGVLTSYNATRNTFWKYQAAE